jgi:LPXTG-motif cell wall-anchored protein
VRVPQVLRVALLVAVVGAGLVGPSAVAAEQTDGAARSGLIQPNRSDNQPQPNQPAAKPGGQDDKKASEDKDDNGKPEGKVDRNRPEATGHDDRNNPGANDTTKGDGDADKAKVDDTPKEDGAKGGNAGAIFIKTGPTTGPGNNPHVGCEFYVSGMNFSSPSGTITFYAWKPTGSFEQVTPVAGPSTYAGSAPSKQADGRNSDFLNGPYSLPTDGQTAHPEQGYHYKVDAINADGKKVDSKVFWVDCQAAPGGSSASPHAPIPAQGGPTNAVGAPTGTTVAATTAVTNAPTTTTGGATDGAAGTPVNGPPPSTTAGATQPAPVVTGPVTVVLTMPVTVGGPNGPIDLPAGTTVTVPTGTALTSLPGAPAPAPQVVEVERGTVLGTTSLGAVTSDGEAIGEVVLGEAASRAAAVLPAALPRTGGAPLGAAAALGALVALAGVVARRRAAP